jgi:hydroxyacylglutathione hydrolase
MATVELAAGVALLPSRPAHAFNSHAVDGVLVDAGTRHAWRRLSRALASVRVTAHAITHAHADHQGSSAAACSALGLPFWAPAGEVDAAESGRVLPLGPNNVVTRWQARHWAGPGHPVARSLREGDTVGSFEVLDTAGHSPGHVSLWRERDRTLIAGDVMFGQHPLTGRAGPREPPRIFTLDPARNRLAIRRLADLRPRLACFGHGPVVRDPGVLADLADRCAAPLRRAGTRG